MNEHGTVSTERLRVADMVALARTIYADAQGSIKHKQMLRPYICPIHILAGHVPSGSDVLDVGCGAGLFIAVLARLDRIRSATGFDTNRPAITVAQKIAARLPNSEQIRFEHRNANDAWPDGRFDVVSLVDVMHHVQPAHQADLIATAVGHIKPGGILLYKDMAKRPLWRASANRLHDLISVGEWIHYVKLDDVIRWARTAGLEVGTTATIDMLWYRHELCVFRRTTITEYRP